MMAATIAWKAEVKDAKKKILLDGERERERERERIKLHSRHVRVSDLCFKKGQPRANFLHR